MHRVPDIRATMSDLDWKPKVGMEEALAALFAYYRDEAAGSRRPGALSRWRASHSRSTSTPCAAPAKACRAAKALRARRRRRHLPVQPRARSHRPRHPARVAPRLPEQGLAHLGVEHYGLRTLLYGTPAAGPRHRAARSATLRAVRDAGFEVGVHCWDHVRWQDRLLVARRRLGPCARCTSRRERHAEVFGSPPRLHGAAGWQFNAAAARGGNRAGHRVRIGHARRASLSAGR